ncbi:Crotonyl-CoA reductase [Pararhodospirillum photometricum DSM 122]|uniref:Crotonyl-CoA reductase n=1 Tax=Pararhodospirillum photometricum DSM 122 TaxID=1150469 RepID=H6SPZ4_PARPM|nr:Crotonyl-CoA reductase [Pararhodospirillum photometricum DSM 122]
MGPHAPGRRPSAPPEMEQEMTSMAAEALSLVSNADETRKDLYELGEIPPLGHVPKTMYAWVIRRERHGEPEKSFQLEVVETPVLDSHDVLVMVMAAGVNYNGIWAGLGQPISPFDVHKAPYHIAGSDAAGIVWAVGSKVTRWKVGDEVVVHCNQDDGDDEECNGGDPMFSPSQRIWGYETADGSFGQFTRVQSRQLMTRPRHLTWEESACYVLVLATAYRMLFGHRPHVLRPGHNVLVWGASGGLGSMAVQLCATAGANAIGVISDESKRDFVMSLGAKGVLNRQDFNCWGQLPKVNGEGFGDYMKEVRKFGKAIWDITGKGNDVDFVFEHPGEQTFPVSCNVVKRGGMVVFCAGTTGFNLTFDARFVWMRQKRIQGSHFANLLQASQANQLVVERRIDPCMSEVFSWDDIPKAHTEDAAQPAQARQHGGACPGQAPRPAHPGRLPRGLTPQTLRSSDRTKLPGRRGLGRPRLPSLPFLLLLHSGTFPA